VPGTTVDAEPKRQQSAGRADLPAALYAAQNGDERGFGLLYRDLQPRLVRYPTVLVGRDDADQLTAEAWLQIARARHNVTGNLDNVRGWASTVVRNRALDFLRVPFQGSPRP
jgi:RNA polymerase sigma-70 factor (ECF subfamily)